MTDQQAKDFVAAVTKALGSLKGSLGPNPPQPFNDALIVVERINRDLQAGGAGGGRVPPAVTPTGG